MDTQKFELSDYELSSEELDAVSGGSKFSQIAVDSVIKTIGDGFGKASKG